MNRAAFYTHLRGTLFKGSMKQPQVTTLEAILNEAERRKTPLTHLSYILATARHEPGDDMQPREESLWYSSAERIRQVWPSRFPSVAAAQPFAKNPRALANKVYNGRIGNAINSDDGWRYRGRGLVQLTGRDNYAKAGVALGLPLLAQPDSANDMVVAVDVMFSGMGEGWFTGVTLAEAAAVPGYIDDRAIVNGRDRAALIAGYAVAFENALRAAAYAAGPPPPPEPIPNITPEELAVLRKLSAWRAACPVDETTLAAVLVWQAALKEVSV